MGTQATACFYEMLHSLQNVGTEQGYLDILLYSKPSIPDRTAYITGQSSDSPLVPLIQAAQTLESGGASCIAIPCATSHFFYDDISQAVNVPIINMLDETVRCAAEQGARKICLLATDGTLKSGIFHKAFEKHGIAVIAPPEDAQANLMDMIYDIKLGIAAESEKLDSIVYELLRNGVDAVVLGCTELCITTKRTSNAINTLEVLANASLSFCKT